VTKATICIDGLETDVYIGATEEEKSRKQKIRWFISISFSDRPRACKSDLLEDTLCYDHIVNMIIEASNAKKYNLLEHLVETAYKKIKSKEVRLLVRASKVIEGLTSYCPSFELKSD